LELGLHLPLMEFGDEGQSFARLSGAVDAARESGFVAVSANDHFLFHVPSARRKLEGGPHRRRGRLAAPSGC
jgi:hypothetical protein